MRGVVGDTGVVERGQSSTEGEPESAEARELSVSAGLKGAHCSFLPSEYDEGKGVSQHELKNATESHE